MGEGETPQMQKTHNTPPAPCRCPQSTHPPCQAPSPPEEGKAALSGYCLGQEGLARARGPVEQKAGAPQAQAQQLRVL